MAVKSSENSNHLLHVTCKETLMHIHRSTKRIRGFTLIELLVVIAIIAI
ncbi:MAG TPA: hypothetical protein DIT97_24925, partial [Gimesia maris]|nr:hypothetical protein [Gimesia maris]